MKTRHCMSVFLTHNVAWEFFFHQKWLISAVTLETKCWRVFMIYIIFKSMVSQANGYDKKRKFYNSIFALIAHFYIIPGQSFPGNWEKIQDFQGLSRKKMKFQDIPGFPGGVRTLFIVYSSIFVRLLVVHY